MDRTFVLPVLSMITVATTTGGCTPPVVGDWSLVSLTDGNKT